MVGTSYFKNNHKETFVIFAKSRSRKVSRHALLGGGVSKMKLLVLYQRGLHRKRKLIRFLSSKFLNLL